jgi:hypothetical protein
MAAKAPNRTWVYLLVGGLLGLLILGSFSFALYFGLSEMAGGGQRLRTLCMSRLAKVSQAQLLYAEDHAGRLPPAPVWMDVTWTYAASKPPEEDSESVFRCPVISSMREGGYGYALNLMVAERPLSEFEKPSAVELVFDSQVLVKNAAGMPQDFFPAGPRHGEDDLFFIAFLDGKVRTYPASD